MHGPTDVAGEPSSVLDQNTRLRAEIDGWQSLCERAGPEYYGSLMLEEGVMVLVDGSILDRGQVIGSLADAPSWDGFELSDVDLIAVGTQAAALVYRAKAWRGTEEPLTAVMSSLYVDVDGRPRLALYQQTAAPHSDGWSSSAARRRSEATRPGET
jgi:hypothetical protein